MIAPLKLELQDTCPGTRPDRLNYAIINKFQWKFSLGSFAFAARQDFLRLLSAGWVDVVENRQKIHVDPCFGPLEDKRNRTARLVPRIIVDDRLHYADDVRSRLDGTARWRGLGRCAVLRRFAGGCHGSTYARHRHQRLVD